MYSKVVNISEWSSLRVGCHLVIKHIQHSASFTTGAIMKQREEDGKEQRIKNVAEFKSTLSTQFGKPLFIEQLPYKKLMQCIINK